MIEKPIPQPACSNKFRVKDHVPMAHVRNVDRSIEFYSLLGFRCESRFSDEVGTYYASMRSEQAEIMFSRASGPITAGEQAVLSYMYSDDVCGLRQHLLAKGLLDVGRVPGELRPGDHATGKAIAEGAAVFEIISPFYMQEGELRVHDPDGYVILIGQAERRYRHGGFGSVAQIGVTVSDVEKATAFYRDIIGLRFLFAAGPNLSFLSDGAIRIMLTTPQGAGQVGANSIIYFKADQIESAYEAVIVKGTQHDRAPQLASQTPYHQFWIGF